MPAGKYLWRSIHPGGAGGRTQARCSCYNSPEITSGTRLGTAVVSRPSAKPLDSDRWGSSVLLVGAQPLHAGKQQMLWPSGQLVSRPMITASRPAVEHTAFSIRAYSSAASASSSQIPRKGKRSSNEEPSRKKDERSVSPKRSALHPPKQAPSVWQIFFTDWLEHQKSHQDEGKKLNVAQAAKEAGQIYSKLSDEERDELKERAIPLKEKYDREFAAWKRSLTPGDVAQENEFRTAQRKSGKSRRKNINDPNAPKRPLSAYFMFLQAIRADSQMLKEVFGDATETTRQSVLAAAKWRSMSNAEKQPYFDQAGNAKHEYEAFRRAYEEQMQTSNEYTVTSLLVYPASPPSSQPVARYESGSDGGMSDPSG